MACVASSASSVSKIPQSGALFACPLCPAWKRATFASKDELSTHMLDTPEAHPYCPICPIKTPFVNIAALITHLTEVHQHGNAYVDNTCNGESKEQVGCKENGVALKGHAGADNGIHKSKYGATDIPERNGWNPEPNEWNPQPNEWNPEPQIKHETWEVEPVPTSENPLPPLTKFTTFSNFPNALFRCEVCSLMHPSLYKLYKHQRGPGGHGRFCAALSKLLYSEVDGRRGKNRYQCDMGCPAGPNLMHPSSIWNHQLAHSHGALWEVAKTVWRETGGPVIEAHMAGDRYNLANPNNDLERTKELPSQASREHKLPVRNGQTHERSQWQPSKLLCDAEGCSTKKVSPSKLLSHQFAKCHGGLYIAWRTLLGKQAPVGDFLNCDGHGCVATLSVNAPLVFHHQYQYRHGALWDAVALKWPNAIPTQEPITENSSNPEPAKASPKIELHHELQPMSPVLETHGWGNENIGTNIDMGGWDTLLL